MKLRITGQSLRFRLKQDEVAKLGEGGSLVATLTLPTGIFIYRLELAAIAAMTVDYQPDHLTVVLPTAATRDWATSDQETLPGEVATPAGPLAIQVEKDFRCRHREGDEAGSFPNPRDRD